MFRGRKSAPLDGDRGDLVVVAASYDDAEGCGAALERAASVEPVWIADAEAVLRHHLRLPASVVSQAVSIAAQEGYGPENADPVAEDDRDPGAPIELVLRRVQILDALHCSQERSRMAGLAQRLGGHLAGWDALQPARNADPAGD